MIRRMDLAEQTTADIHRDRGILLALLVLLLTGSKGG